MIKSVIMLKVILALMFSGVAFSDAKLNIQIKNIQVGRGSVVVEVYDSKENFDHKKWLASKTLKATSESLQFIFDLPEGIYAVKIFQDINENRKCDEGWFHILKEPYGLGNNFRPKLSAPSFDNCKFPVTELTTQTIILKK